MRKVQYRFMLVLGSFAAFAGLSGSVATAASVGSSRIEVRYFRTSGGSLRNLVAGGVGSGVLDYYKVGLGWQSPSLLVQLSHSAKSKIALARVFDVSVASHPLVRLQDGRIVVSSTFHPVLVMRAVGGWWKRGGKANYSLTVDAYGPMYAMWGGPTYPTKILPHELLARIVTHANSQGVPQWDFRQLVPQYPGDGVIRSNYAQRTGPGPLRFVSSVSPLWPYVAKSGYFTQPNGQMVPPIIVNWNTGKVTMFSEIVTVREQNDSYDFYSITPITVGKVNHPDFETPWGFYDLSGRGQGYPNLIIRNEHYFADDPYSVGIARYLLGTSGIPKPNEVIRYTWADHPGNDYFNYMINVFGYNSYTTKVPIMNGRTWVVAPAYHSYPEWVIDHKWPITTFIDTNGGGYATSEGIYQWSSRTSLRYLLGWTSHPNLSEFQSIIKGFRGEYRLGVARRPLLYMSPIDHEIHLLYAQVGLSNLGGGVILREENENGGPYLNVWQLWQMASSSVKHLGTKKRSRSLKEVAQLAIADGYAIDSGPKGVTIERLSNPSQSLGTISPPTTHDTWLSFKHSVKTLGKGANPLDLADWVAAIPGVRMRIAHSTLRDLHITSNGFQFVLSESKPIITGKVLGVTIPPSTGTYVVRYSKGTGTWSVLPGSVPKLSASIRSTAQAKTLYPMNIAVAVTNHGSEPWDGPVRVAVGSEVLSSQTPWIGGGSKDSTAVTWDPSFSGSHEIRVYAGNKLIAQTAVDVAATGRGSISSLLSLSLPGNVDLDLLIILMLGALVISGGVMVWRRVT